jgi:hypothetical protein
MRIEKVVLINLPSEGQCADRHTPLYVSDEFAAYPPLGLLYVATAIKDYYPKEVIDLATMRLSIEQSFEAIVARQPRSGDQIPPFTPMKRWNCLGSTSLSPETARFP